mgnify:CR=1 FL=1
MEMKLLYLHGIPGPFVGPNGNIGMTTGLHWCCHRLAFKNIHRHFIILRQSISNRKAMEASHRKAKAMEVSHRKAKPMEASHRKAMEKDAR